MAEQGTSRSASADALAALTIAQKLSAGLAAVKRERDLLENAAQAFADLFHADYVGMLIAQPDGSGRVTGEYPIATKLDGLVMSPDVRLISEHCARNVVTTVGNITDSVLLSQKAREAFLQAKLSALALLPMGEHNGRWFGSVMLGFNRDLALAVGALDTGAALAQQVGGLALAVRHVERTQRQVTQFTALLTLSQAMGRAETEEAVGYEIAKAISTVLPVTQFAILRGNPKASSLELIARWESGYTQPIRREQMVLVEVNQTLVSLIGDSDDVVDVPDFFVTEPPLKGLLQMATYSGLAAPLQVGGGQIGVVVIESDHTFAYNEVDKVIFSQLVAQMNVSLTGLSASSSLMRSATGSNAVNMVSQNIQGETSAYGVMRSGTLATLRALKATRVSTRLGNPNADADDTYPNANVNGTERTRT